MKICTDKECPHGDQPQPLSNFHTRKASPDGLSYRCVDCKARRDQEYRLGNEILKTKKKQYVEQNKDALREYHRQYRIANKEQINKTKREARARDPERYNQYSREYYANNKEKHAARTKQYREANSELINTLGRHRRALIAEAEGSHTPEEVLQMLEDQEGLCAYCEDVLVDGFHVEHMQPLSRGGRNDWPNLAIVCLYCNSSKGTQTTEEFFSR